MSVVCVASMYACMYIYVLCVCLHVCLSVFMCLCMCARQASVVCVTYECVCVYMHVCVCMHVSLHKLTLVHKPCNKGLLLKLSAL